ncbi:TonB-dependent receptor [Oceanospirillaceae bacterium ASx5O]|nr:TonB-dependent receptor [Oceanospirillaceae bacterium ASx5O]
MRNKLFLAISALAGAGLASFTQLAVANDEGVTLPLQVVSATGYRQQALLAPAAITVIDREQISRAPVADLADVFREVPGVTVVDSGVPGMKRLSLRGESARRVLIKVNGQPLSDHSNYGTPMLIDVATIERIEVVRGSASVVHGSNAVGGVVNVITRQAQSGEQEINLNAGYYSATRGHKVSAGVLGASERIDWRLQASQTQHDDRRIPDGRLDDTDNKQQALSAELGFHISEQQKLSWQGEFFDLEAGAWAEPGSGIDSMRFPERSSQRYGVVYEYADATAPVLQRFSARAYRHDDTRRFDNAVAVTTPIMSTAVDNASDDDLLTEGVQLNLETTLLGNNITLFGLEYQRDELETDKRTETTITPPGIPTIKTSSQLAEQSFWSAFVQQQLRLTRQLEANIGVRYYDIDSSLERSTERNLTSDREEKVVGSAALVWQLQDDSALRLNIAQGYTYPSVTQQFAVTAGGSDIHFGNPDLKSERSTTVELGWRLDNRQWTADITLYQSTADDFIGRESLGMGGPAVVVPDYSTPTTTRQRLWRWVNIAEAETRGLEASLMFHAGAISPYLNISAQQRNFDYGNGYDTWDSGLPQYQLRTGLQWEVQPDLSLDFYIRSYGDATLKDETGVVEEETSSYVEYNLAAQYRPTLNLNITAALRNITDKAYRNPEELPAAERALDMEVSWRF